MLHELISTFIGVFYFPFFGYLSYQKNEFSSHVNVNRLIQQSHCTKKWSFPLKISSVNVTKSGRGTFYLTHIMPMFYSYKNQSIGLLHKLIDWFLYKCNIDLILVDWAFYLLPRTRCSNFPLRISSVNVIKSAVSCEFGHIYWRNP